MKRQYLRRTIENLHDGDVQLNAAVRPRLLADSADDFNRVIEFQMVCVKIASRADALDLAGAVFQDDKGCSRKNTQTKNPAANEHFLSQVLVEILNEDSTDGSHHKPHR